MGNSIKERYKYLKKMFNSKLLSIYEGHLPVLVTSDLDIIQEVFIKQSKNFSARKVIFKNIVNSCYNRQNGSDMYAPFIP